MLGAIGDQPHGHAREHHRHGTSAASRGRLAQDAAPWRLDLGGSWARAVGGAVIDEVAVPGSYAPVGACVLSRTFSWDASAATSAAPSARLFLVSEGVLASARFVLNGVELGTAAAWAPYRFEIPAHALRAGANAIEAHVRDLEEPFGPMPGRRCDGGLIRPLWIEARAHTWLAGVRWSAGLSADCASARPGVAVALAGGKAARVAVVLTDEDGVVVARGECAGNTAWSAEVDRPRLWSPEHPHLYTLAVWIVDAPRERIVERVGFRRIEARGRDLWLNNRRLVLKGVCRHEFSDAWGYSPPAAAVRHELARIRHAGFNYVRLVHSPQAALVCRIAAQIGLLVSEEPGTCWHDLGDEAIAAPALECLRRTVERDRNVPSILAWFLYNECAPHAGYAKRAAALVRALDPEACTAMADCSGDDAALRAMAEAASLTCYGINVYGHTRKPYIERMRQLADRPLIITEWSGFIGQGNERQLSDLCAGMVRHTRAHEPLRISGGSIWVWADYEERSRPHPATVAGWTCEGLVRADGSPKPDLAVLSQMCFDMDHDPVMAPVRAVVLCAAPARPRRWRSVPLERAASGQQALEARMDELRAVRDVDTWLTLPADHDGYRFTPPLPRFGRLLVDGIPFDCHAGPGGHPLLLGPGRAMVEIAVDARVDAVAVLGQVMVGGGYPAPPVGVWGKDDTGARERGAPAAQYRFLFSDGSEIVQPLRHGLEVLRHNDICRSWSPAPRAPNTRPAARAVVDQRYEIMRLDLWERALPVGERVAVRWELLDPGALLVMAGRWS